jgi:hypothetical protein
MSSLRLAGLASLRPSAPADQLPDDNAIRIRGSQKPFARQMTPWFAFGAVPSGFLAK